MKTFHLIGLPTDVNSSFARGPAQAPAAIRAALYSDRGNNAAENGLEAGADFQLLDQGDLPLTETPGDDTLIAHAATAAIAAGAVPIFLGGDHAVSAPILVGVNAALGPVHIIHIDAHPDTYADFQGNPRSHASPFARILERGHAASLTQIGLRTVNRHCRDQAARYGVRMIEMKDFAVDALPRLTGPVYLSVDIDGVDPAFAPGVSHPEPGGLSVREVLAILRRIDAPIIGADIVELNPVFDTNQITAILAAKLIREIAARATEG